MKKITQKRLKELFYYDPVTGVFVWLARRAGTARAGSVAGRFHNKKRRQIGVDGVIYNAGVLAWTYVTGEFPTCPIDHINRNGDDNRFENLRKASVSQNMANRRATPSKYSPYRGVRPLRERWNAVLSVDGKRMHLGGYASAEAAAIAYDLAAHKHFGEFAVLNFPNAPKRDWILV